MSAWHAADLAAFEAHAATFARDLRAGDTVALEGDLGAGKTTFVAAVVRALGRDAEVASPTFTFWHRYGGEPPIEHLDFYRIESRADASELGLAEAFDPGGIVFVEWPEMFAEIVPARAIRVRIRGVGEGAREIRVERP